MKELLTEEEQVFLSVLADDFVEAGETDPLELELLLCEAECLMRTGIISMPKPFMDAIVNQKRGDGTKVIVVYPTLTREDFIKTLPSKESQAK